MINDFQNEYICGRKFQGIADKVWDTDRKDNLDDLKDGDIIWCVRFSVDKIFPILDRHPYKKVILISNNGDWCVDEKLYSQKSSCVKVWFSQNVNCKYPNLFTIPIGLENDFGPSKGRYTDYSYLKSKIDRNINVGVQKTIDKIYCNFTVKNNVNDRTNAINHLEAVGLGSMSSRKSFPDYCEDIRRHRFIMSPNGNGIDCHKTWETLYLGSIPIVQSHFMFDEYCGLPIIQVDDVKEINQEWLMDKLEWYNSTTFNYEELKVSYWLEKIINERSKL